MNNNYLIIVTGQVATGKTRFARFLSQELNIPLICKDDIKEILFDELGTGDREYSRKLGISCYKIIYYTLEQFIGKTSMILESNFNYDIATKEIGQLKKKFNFKAIQVFLYANSDIVYDRFKQRIKNGERHSGHIDHVTKEDFRDKSLLGGKKPLTINGEIIKINTNDFSKIDYRKISNKIKEMVK